MSIELDALTADLQNYIVAPLNQFGLGGFVFDVEGEATTRLVAEITDHYTEDNKAVQDHIARKPKMVTLRGYVGELTYKPDSGSVSGVIQSLTQKLTTISAFLPQISAATQQAQSVATNQTIGFNEGVSDTADLYALVKNVIGSFGDQANQQKAYLYFKACWEQGILMGIQTPWEFLTNMAIESVTAIQSENSQYISDFSVTYKQMRFAKTISSAYSPAQPTGTAAAAGGDPTNPSSYVAPGASTDAVGSNPGNLSTQANQGPLTAYRSTNGLDTPTIDKVLDGAASIQAPDPVSIGTVTGVSLPSTLLSGSQQFIMQASDLLSNSSVAKTFIRAVGQ